jgi:hypothetical protein
MSVRVRSKPVADNKRVAEHNKQAVHNTADNTVAGNKDMPDLC